MFKCYSSAGFRLSASALAVAFFGVSATGQDLFRDEMTSGAGWGVNADADTLATFGYDYSADFIPEAPNSQGGDTATSGVKLEANIVSPSAGAAMSLYPLGQNFTGPKRLRFDAWTNYDVNERINGGSAGTTEFIGGGLGYDNTSTDIGPGMQLIATNDGGSGSDWRAFNDGVFLDPDEMTGGSRNGFVPYYADFLPGISPPAGQAQVASPPGVAGSPGFQWLTFEFRQVHGKVLMTVEKPGGERLRIAEIDALAGQSDGNIMLFYADFFSSVTSRPDLTFGIIDNVVVAAPEPASATLLGLAALGMMRRRR